MQITAVSVRYGELRSTGYPSYSNRRYEIELSAALESGETGSLVKTRLLEIARREVHNMFVGPHGPPEPADEMCKAMPF